MRVLTLLGLGFYFISCKNLASGDVSPFTKQNIELTSNVKLINISESTELIIHPDMSSYLQVGTKVNLKEYLNEQGFSSFAKILKTDNGRDYLFTQYYTGGAHCCIILEAYQFDISNNQYRFINSYSFDGDIIDMDYPFNVSDRIEYFHCAYSDGSNILCPRSNFSKNLYFINNEFTIKAKGDISQMEVCFKEFINKTNIPELNVDGDDDGSRETIVNFLYDMYSIDKDINHILKIYNQYFPKTKDKKALWDEIKSSLTGITLQGSPFKNVAPVFNQNFTSSTNTYSPPDISSLSCDELLELVVDNGDRVEELADSDMDSSALDYAALYEYDATYYVIAQFTTSRKRYIYCDVRRSDWNNFTDNDDNSYGSGFDDYISRYNCSCN